MSRPQLGVLGGSFDPPHVAHVMLALLGLSLGGLTRVIVVPAFKHAFGKALAPFEQRLRMCELAFQDLSCVDVDPIESELGGVSRTLRLVEALAQRHPDSQLRLLIGSDILEERARWQDFERIERIAPPLVAARAGYAADAATLGPLLPKVSSTELRDALARGVDLGLLPLHVRDYVHAHGLYRDAP